MKAHINSNQTSMENQPLVVKNVMENLNKSALSSTDQITKPSIHRIPDFIRGVQPIAFEPMVVSLGPYHHGKPHLASMELAKLNMFHHFLSTYALEVRFVVERVWSLFEELEGSYDTIRDEQKEETERLMQLYVVDGCFVIEFLNNCPRWLRNMKHEIKRDMLLLENQLPKKLLDFLCSMANINEIGIQTIQKHFSHQGQPIPKDVEERQYSHILDMYRSVLLYPKIKKTTEMSQSRNKSGSGSANSDSQFDPECQTIRHATQLHKAGVKFRRSKTESFTDVSFEGSTLRLPRVILDDGTESALLNVMAYEKLHIGAGHRVTSFVAFMDNLIDVDQDVALLTSEGIIANALGDDRAVANLFKLLNEGALKNSTNLAMVNKKVHEHCKKPWNEWCASLKHIYFQNPWTIISVFAAIFGFVILILQAVYQICDYYEVPSRN